MNIYGFSFEGRNKQPVIILRSDKNQTLLPIIIGHPEAASILAAIQGKESPRPMTHDLAIDIFNQMDIKCVEAILHGAEKGIFYATLVLEQNGKRFELDTRPSDAFALIVRSEAPIKATDELIEELGVSASPQEEQEVVEDFKAFLENVSPEDFEG